MHGAQNITKKHKNHPFKSEGRCFKGLCNRLNATVYFNVIKLMCDRYGQ